MRIATTLGPLELAGWSGGRVRLGTLWEQRPVVLVFIRHFG